MCRKSESYDLKNIFSLFAVQRYTLTTTPSNILKFLYSFKTRKIKRLLRFFSVKTYKKLIDVKHIVMVTV